MDNIKKQYPTIEETIEIIKSIDKKPFSSKESNAFELAILILEKWVKEKEY